MDSCQKCSAPAIGAARVCGYCGAVMVELISAKEELVAVSELSTIAVKLNKRKAAHLWQHAFVPTTLDAQVAALTQSLSLLQKTTIMSFYRGYSSMAFGVLGAVFATPDINAIALSRCDAILTAMRLASVSEPHSAAQVELAEREVERAREGLAESKRRVLKRLGWGVLAYLIFMALAMLVLFSTEAGLDELSVEPQASGANYDLEQKGGGEKITGK